MHKKVEAWEQTDHPPRRGRGRPRAFDRDEALAKAMRLFWMKGYEATSIADLTDAMGVGSTSLYAAFGSKDELYAEALRFYARTYEQLTLGRFRQATTAREAISAYLQDSAAAMTGYDCELPRGCLINLGTVGSDGHDDLATLMRAAREVAFELLKGRLDLAVTRGEIPANADVTAIARYVQTVQSGMAIRARDGATRADLGAVAALSLAGWDSLIAASSAGEAI